MPILSTNKAKHIKIIKLNNKLKNSGKNVQSVLNILDQIIISSEPPENCKKITNIYVDENNKLAIQYEI